MRKEWLIIFFVSLSLLAFSLTAFAKTSDEYIDEVYALLQKGEIDEALAVVREGCKEYPGDISLVFAAADVFLKKKDFETAIINYRNLLNAIEAAGKEPFPALHAKLSDAYNQLGQKHYFPKELCLRIIYHTEKYLELEPQFANDPRFIEFLRKTIGHYDMAATGAKMMEQGGDGLEFELPDDFVSPEQKLLYKDKAVARLKKYDEALRAELTPTAPSDKTVEEITQVIYQHCKPKFCGYYSHF